jgi:hypothetical protein
MIGYGQGVNTKDDNLVLRVDIRRFVKSPMWRYIMHG